MRWSDLVLALPVAGVGMLVAGLTLLAVRRQRAGPLPPRGCRLIALAAAVPTLVLVIVIAVTPVWTNGQPRPDTSVGEAIAPVLWLLLLVSPLVLFGTGSRLVEVRHLGWRGVMVGAAGVQFAMSPLLILAGAQAVSLTPL